MSVTISTNTDNVEEEGQEVEEGGEEVEEGGEVNLTCIAGQDGVQYSWSFKAEDGQTKPNISAEQQLYIKPAKNSDAGEYTCHASTHNATGSATVQVRVRSNQGKSGGVRFGIEKSSVFVIIQVIISPFIKTVATII